MYTKNSHCDYNNIPRNILRLSMNHMAPLIFYLMRRNRLLIESRLSYRTLPNYKASYRLIYIRLFLRLRRVFGLSCEIPCLSFPSYLRLYFGLHLWYGIIHVKFPGTWSQSR